MIICASGFMSGFCNVLHFACLFYIQTSSENAMQCNASSKQNQLTSKKERYSIAVSGVPSNGNGVCAGITGVASPGVCMGSVCVGFPSSGISVGNTGSDGMICVGASSADLVLLEDRRCLQCRRRSCRAAPSMQWRALWSTPGTDLRLGLPMGDACRGCSILPPLRTRSTRLAGSLTAILTEQRFGCGTPSSE